MSVFEKGDKLMRHEVEAQRDRSDRGLASDSSAPSRNTPPSAGSVCPRCGDDAVPGERGLMWCSSCNHTWHDRFGMLVDLVEGMLMYYKGPHHQPSPRCVCASCACMRLAKIVTPNGGSDGSNDRN